MAIFDWRWEVTQQKSKRNGRRKLRIWKLKDEKVKEEFNEELGRLS